ncbi:hypothetical protein SRHO_G00101480 [Serrasalmus rhombeus]
MDESPSDSSPAASRPSGCPSLKGKEKDEQAAEKPATSSSSKPFAGHASKPVPPTSPSSVSGRAKMSVCGPGSKNPAPSSSSLSSPSSSSSSNPPPKVHRARKTMNRPPLTQVRSVEASAVTPVKPAASSSSEPDTAVKKRKVETDSDSTAPPAESPAKVAEPQPEPPVTVTPVNVSPVAQKVEPVATVTKDHPGSWLEDLDDEADEEDFHLMYNSYAGDDVIYSDGKSDDGIMEEPLEVRMGGDTGHRPEQVSPSEQPRAGLKKKQQGKERDTAAAAEPDAAAAPAGGSIDYTEVPLGSLDISAADSLTLSPHTEGSDREMERMEELPLCSCRMEAPRVERLTAHTQRTCMAIESINGQLVGCTNKIMKGETMRPSSRVSLMVLCETHRSHMVKHHCCPGCGYFCLSGTFLECCPDVRIAHRFHRGCVSVLGSGRSRCGAGGGLLFCPHCGEDASEAQEVTIPPATPSPGATVVTATASSTTATPSLLPSTLTVATAALSNEKRTGEPISARMHWRGEARKGVEPQLQTPSAAAGGGVVEDVVAQGDGGVDSVGPSLVLPNGKPVCPSALPPGDRRAALQRAILTQDTERKKKLRFHPRQLYPAAKQGEVQKVLLMLMEGIDPAFQPDSQNRRSALHAAAQRGLLDVCYLLIQAGAKLDAQDKSLRTPLLEAIMNNQVEVARFLMQSGACVYHVEEDGSTGLHHAAKLGNLEIITLLLNTGQVDINAQHRNITHLQHCSCTDDCSSSNCLCGQLSIRCWYDKDQRLLQEFNKIEPPLIFECNLACSCYKSCKNRVVQAGIKVRLQLYRTEKMGWGVRALQDIPQGSFICEYVGELISDAEADVREDDSYLFDLDNKDGEVYCIDARYYGNISRFINHLCDPNIIPVRVFMLHQDLRFPRIAFFSSRDILTGQELGFDYGDRFWDIKSKYFTCQCGSEKCKHSAEAIALEQSRLARMETCPESGSEPALSIVGNS